MEGVSHAGTVTLRGQYQKFEKCYFKTIAGPSWNTAIVLRDASFVSCIIESFQTTTQNGGTNFTYVDNTQFANSLILNLGREGNHVLTNCVAKLENNTQYLNAMTIRNSILYYSVSNSYNSNNAYSSFHSIGVNTVTGSSYNYYHSSTPLSQQDLLNIKGLNNVFENFNGTSYTHGVTDLHLKGDAAAMVDEKGRPIGIYGGIMPFDPRVRNPLIGKVTVAPTTTSAGILQVDIQLNEPTNNTNTNTDPNN